MYSSMWFMSIVALLVVDVRTGALQDGDIRPSRCHACALGNGTTCDGNWPSVACPDDRPLCATVAIAPDFVSSLACAAATKTPCSIRNHVNNSIELTCVCHTQLCNTPFTPELRHELLNFTLPAANSTVDMALIFFQTSKFANFTDDNLYKAITIELSETTTIISRNLSQTTTMVTVPGTINTQTTLRDVEKPRAEPLKQEPTAPSDDDEDEGEGSGADEEARVHNHAASAPAAPSSFLPAKENSAPPLYTNLLLTTLFTYLLV